ncbi:NAD(P)-binding domain-containing protein [Kitasatospora sp. NBC_00070]|uniref:FAD-dependent oxidoreductase n=1 Tax=Kitasatospora sp. NBC_00070 TaxID=2975962 RepID=UPI0032432D49
MTTAEAVPVTVIGAGPYGLATAAHLRGSRVPLRVFGEPMESWRARMPAGMYLKSTPSASSISDPAEVHRLDDFRTADGRVTGGDLYPVPIDEFIRYGLWFQERCVPALERTTVRRIDAGRTAFRIALEDGEEFTSRQVVLATGLGAYPYLPRELAPLAEAGLASHSSEHQDLTRFAGRRVAVLGAGQSALESAALLHEAGAEPTVVARTDTVLFGTPPETDRSTDRTLTVRVTKPGSPLGPGWSLFAFSRAPGAFRHLPDRTRLHFVRTVLGPSGAWWLRDRVEGRVPVLTGHRLGSAQESAGRVRLALHRPGGGTELLDADHVLAATGYRVDVDRLGLLGPELRRGLRRIEGAPRLDQTFQSSVPGLYFTGLASAATFGPLMRFVCGTGFAAQRICATVAGAVR